MFGLLPPTIQGRTVNAENAGYQRRTFALTYQFDRVSTPTF
jgi:hypothetical protein